MFFGVSVATVLVAGASTWGATMPLAASVIAAGQVVVESNVRRVQHPTGGVIADIRANDGDRVKAGDVLVRLDETVTRATLAVIEHQLNQFVVRQARLVAERDGLPHFKVPSQLNTEDPAIARTVAGERSLFTARQDAVTGLKSQYAERISQVREEIRGLTAQAASKREQIRLIQVELQGVRQLYQLQLVPLSRLTALERDAARLVGEEGQHVSDVARAKGRITETELQIIQVGQEQRREVATELRDVETKVTELVERHTAAFDQLKRIDIRAPQNGVVHQKSVHTIGGVINAGEQIMLIVPENDNLVVEVRIDPSNIDRLIPGQSVTIRFSAFSSASIPDVFGTFYRISADITRDPQTGAMYYLARISIPASELEKLGNKALVPGMPVETFIDTGSRTALAYLLKPIRDQVFRALRYD
jgi:HlyD family secretion protein